MTGSVDSLHPEQVEWGFGLGTGEKRKRFQVPRSDDGYQVAVLPADAYRQLFARWERERDAREKAEAERDGWRDQVAQAVELEQAAEELAEAALARLNSELSSHPKLAAALARFRDTQKQEGQNDE